jgi:WhiB family redox-sensing transcriptional regulator
VPGQPGSGGTLVLPILPRGLALPLLPGALCKGADPGVWFPSVNGWHANRAAGRAKAVCAACPARVRCLEWALEAGESEGVWGGTTPAERVAIRRRRASGGGG